jgi:hypothetical protein
MVLEWKQKSFYCISIREIAQPILLVAFNYLLHSEFKNQNSSRNRFIHLCLHDSSDSQLPSCATYLGEVRHIMLHGIWLANVVTQQFVL